MKKEKCPICKQTYYPGYNGTVDGHDDCTGTTRDNRENSWRDGEQVIKLMDDETEEVTTVTRRRSLRWW